MESLDILSAAKSRLQSAFGPRLRGVLMHGSRARGTAAEDGDLDLLVLLNDPVHLGDDLATIVDALYSLQLDTPWPIHASPASYSSYINGDFAVYRRARDEGVLA